jgi:hypothetical protein
MNHIIHHILGTCGEPHISLLGLLGFTPFIYNFIKYKFFQKNNK